MANSLPSENYSLIEAHINGFNTGDNNLFLSVFGEIAIIIDGIAPYRWLNQMLQPIASLTHRNGVRTWV